MLILIAGGMASEARMLALALANSSHDVVIVDAPPRTEPLELLPLSIERVRSLQRDTYFEPAVLAERDDRRNDPQRDVAMLRREMLARERSNRHMLKKWMGRR